MERKNTMRRDISGFNRRRRVERRKDTNNVRRIISAGFIVFRHTEEGLKFLLLYRGRNAWDMPRGRMETQENSLETAFREVREETGLRASDLIIKRDFHRAYEKFPYSRDKERVFKIIIFYLAETPKREIKLSDEHEGYGWFTLAEARKQLSRFKVRQAILKRAADFIHNEINGKKEKESPSIGKDDGSYDR